MVLAPISCEAETNERGEEMSHHTPEQIRKALARAPEILAKCKAMGLLFPSLELFDDASATLWFEGKIDPGQLGKVTALIHSQRPFVTRGHRLGIPFCCGLIDHDEGKEADDGDSTASD